MSEPECSFLESCMLVICACFVRYRDCGCYIGPNCYGAQQLCWIEISQVVPSSANTSDQYEEMTPNTSTKPCSNRSYLCYDRCIREISLKQIVKTNQYISVNKHSGSKMWKSSQHCVLLPKSLHFSSCFVTPKSHECYFEKSCQTFKMKFARWMTTSESMLNAIMALMHTHYFLCHRRTWFSRN